MPRRVRFNLRLIMALVLCHSCYHKRQHLDSDYRQVFAGAPRAGQHRKKYRLAHADNVAAEQPSDIDAEGSVVSPSEEEWDTQLENENLKQENQSLKQEIQNLRHRLEQGKIIKAPCRSNCNRSARRLAVWKERYHVKILDKERRNPGRSIPRQGPHAFPAFPEGLAPADAELAPVCREERQ